MKKRKSGSLFIPTVLIYAALVLIVCWLCQNRLDKGMISLILFGLVPLLILVWLRDVLAAGEFWRQGPKSLTAASTMHEQKISRQDQPVCFWLAIVASAIFALAILTFVIVGMAIKIIGT